MWGRATRAKGFSQVVDGGDVELEEEERRLLEEIGEKGVAGTARGRQSSPLLGSPTCINMDYKHVGCL